MAWLPMPGAPGDAFTKGIDTGSGMFQRLMQPILHREDASRQWAQHQDNLALQQQAQNIRAQAAAREAEMFPMQKEAQELNLQSLRREVDPRAKMDYYRQLQQMYSQMQGGASQPVEGAQQGSFVSGGLPSGGDAQGNQSQVAQTGALIQTPFGMVSPQEAQNMLAMGMNFPGVQEQLKAYYKGAFGVQEASGKEQAKAQIKEDAERGASFQGLQRTLDGVSRIKQSLQNYEKEAADLGYKPRVGFGAEMLTEPNAIYRLMGTGFQKASHPIETLMHPMDLMPGSREGSDLHKKHLSSLRTQLNEMVNERAKDLNTRFTEKEYTILQANKPSISDDIVALKAKLDAVESAVKTGYERLMAEHVVSQGQPAGAAPFALESQAPAGAFGRQAAGSYASQSDRFIDPNNPAYLIVRE